MGSFERKQARELAERHRKMGYIEVRDTRFLRLVCPLKDTLTITASYGGADYPEKSVADATASIPSPSENRPRCVLVGRKPGTDSPDFLTDRREIGVLVHAAIALYQDADRKATAPRFPKMLASLDEALAKAGLPPITDEPPPIDAMALFTSPLMSRLAGLLVFGLDQNGAYCSVTRVSLNPVSVAINPPFVDFSSICFISAGTSWRP